MKKRMKFLGVMVLILLLMPLQVVFAKTKTDVIVDQLRDSVQSFDGTVIYENGTIDVNWNMQNSNTKELTFSYNGNVIEYNSGDITNYEMAEDVTDHIVFSTELMNAALQLNGYSKDEILAFMRSEERNLDYDINGILFEPTGESQEFTSLDGFSTTTVSPFSIKIDVSKANLNKIKDDELPGGFTTIQDVVEKLQSDSSFTTMEDDGKIIYQNDISFDDEDNKITIYHTYYWDDYYNVSFSCVDDVITYEDESIDSYEDAERASSHHMYADLILTSALKMNGYTVDEIREFLMNENNEFNYDINGIEFKVIGETKEFTTLDGTSTVSTTPMRIKIDLKKANLNKFVKYNTLDGDNQTIQSGNQLTFRFDILYSKFLEEGKVYMDGEEVDSSNYTSKEGSTIITFNSDYVKNLSNGEHTVKVTVRDGKANAKFNVTDNQQGIINSTSNPDTGDNIMFFISLLGISLAGLLGFGIYTKKRCR